MEMGHINTTCAVIFLKNESHSYPVFNLYNTSNTTKASKGHKVYVM